MADKSNNGQGGRSGPVTQITLKCNRADPVSVDFFRHIENRDRELYPTIFSYLNAAVEALEVTNDDDRGFTILSASDLKQIGMIVMEALRAYELKKNEEQMVP